MHRCLTQTKQPPENPGRFTALKQRGLYIAPSVPAALSGLDVTNFFYLPATLPRKRNITFSLKDTVGVSKGCDRSIGFKAVTGAVINGVPGVPKIAT